MNERSRFKRFYEGNTASHVTCSNKMNWRKPHCLLAASFTLNCHAIGACVDKWRPLEFFQVEARHGKSHSICPSTCWHIPLIQRVRSEESETSALNGLKLMPVISFWSQECALWAFHSTSGKFFLLSFERNKYLKFIIGPNRFKRSHSTVNVATQPWTRSNWRT